MKTIWAGLVFFVFAAGPMLARALDPTLADSRAAAALLGPEFSPQILRIRNSGATGKYPAEFHAVIFELENILWFYCAIEGTQSLSRRRGHVAEERKNIGELLRAIDPALREWEFVQVDNPSRRAIRSVDEPLRRPLRNGCFVESVDEFRREFLRGVAGRNPRLLLYYPRENEGRGAHTVLVYDVVEGVKLVDPSRGALAQNFSRALGEKGEDLAARYAGCAIARARWLSLDNSIPVLVASHRVNPLGATLAG